ncbi:hypothetical protein QE152_g6940 [Popillia japonica]|uniref:Uncharacterized protein n=1 Tax=Popillia japonica TaxID=7064 RepID=A0AAW1MH12_POPJA
MAQELPKTLTANVDDTQELPKTLTANVDDMDASLSNDSKVDYTVGWEDYGDGYKNIAFANHAIVFTLRGIKQK